MAIHSAISQSQRRRGLEELSKSKRRPSMYKTREVDYSKLVTVRIDNKTFIYAKPGREAATKKAFLKHYGLPPKQPRGVFIDN